MDQAWTRARGAFAALLAPPGLFLVLFFLVPLGTVWLYSFGENRGLTEIAVTGTVSNYARALQPLYLGIFWKSAWIGALVTLACLIAGFPTALGIAFASERLKPWLLLMVVLPFWTNLLVRTFALIAVLRDEGYVNQVLGFGWKLVSAAPFQPLQMLHNDGAVVLGLVYVQLPFMVLPIYAALERMDRSLLEASLDLGAGQLQTLGRIVVPLAWPGIASGLLITFTPTIGAFLTSDLLGGPDSLMIANVIERQFKRANDWPFGAALSFVLMYLTFFALAARPLLARRRR